MSKGKQIAHTVRVEKVVLGGQGLAHLENGCVVLVPHVLPGETVSVAITAQKKQYAEAELVEVHEASPYRLQPPCPYFSICGGCDLQHTTYANQLTLKHDYFCDALARALPEIFSSIQISPVLASPNPFHYRQRVRFQIDRSGRIGYFEKGSHRVLEIDACLLACAKLNDVLRDLFENKRCFSVLEQAVVLEMLLSPGDGLVVVILHLARKPRAADIQSAQLISREIGLVKSVWLAAEGVAMSGPFVENRGAELTEQKILFSISGGDTCQEIDYALEPGGFCQVNITQNQQLVSLMLDWVRAEGVTGRALDLFCGMGNFSLPLARTLSSVLGTDLQRSSIRSAQANAEKNGISNCTFSRSDAASAVAQCIKEGEKFSLILLDPPRQGCSKEIISQLPALGADSLLYISCNPATLARDLSMLVQLGYTIVQSRGVDMFPQTYHIESITLLRRGG